MVYLVHEDFLDIAKLVAKSKGAPILPCVVLPRTINSIPTEEVEALAEKDVEKVVELLKTGALESAPYQK